MLALTDTGRVPVYEAISVVGRAEEREDAVNDLMQQFGLSAEDAEKLMRTNLTGLVGLGLPVPSYVVLTVDAYRACCPEGEVPSQEDAGLAEVLDVVWSEVGAGKTPLAVRSSAVDEDGKSRSWAGQMETFLNVTTSL